MTTPTTEMRFLPRGLSVSMSLFQSLDIIQHDENDTFFDNVWNMLKPGGIYAAPNGSTPMMIKNETDNGWVLVYDSDHPKSHFWSQIGN